jgi:hypothetical protein
VLNWFEYPYLLVSGDFRPPLVNEAFVKRVLYTWDETDLGMPSVYAPRIIDPYCFFIIAFQTLGVSLYFSQIIAVFLTYFFASILMYIYVKQITNGDIIAAFIAALFLTSNVHLIVDREIVAIGFLDLALMILPCLITFTEGIKKKSYTMIGFSGLLFTLTYGTFPNYRVVLLCLIALALTLFFIYINSGVKVTYGKNGSSKFISTYFDLSLLRTYLKYLSLFILFLFFASIWVIVIIFTNFDIFSITYEQMAAPAFATYADYIKPHDVLRLIARWSFYETGLGKPYVPFADVYLHNPLIIILSYFPTILAFASLLTSKSRKCTIYFSVLAVLFLTLTSAFSPYFIPVYLNLVANLPLMRAFRESIHWIFFVILSYGILIGITLSTICDKLRNKTLQILALSLAIILFLSTTYPLTTGDVARNWLNPSVKGSYFPASYVELNDMLPKEYWSIILPQSYTYSVYNFTGGLWGCGNPYPLIFSKPIISGVGTEYALSQNLELINELYEQIQTGINCRNIAPEGRGSAGSKETDGVPKFLGILGIKYLILEKNKIAGSRYPVGDLDLELHNNQNFNLIREWDDVELFDNIYALQKLYVADNILSYTTIDEMYKVTENLEWKTLNHSAFVNSTSMNEIANKMLTAPKNLVWNETSSIRYEVNLESNSSFMLVLLESYDKHWKMYVNGNLLPETNHLKVNGFANGWLIENIGNLEITIYCETQNSFTTSVIASAVLSALLFTFVARKNIKIVANKIKGRFKRKTT